MVRFVSVLIWFVIYAALQKQNTVTRCSDLLNVTFLMSFKNDYGIVKNHVWENYFFNLQYLQNLSWRNSQEDS